MDEGWWKRMGAADIADGGSGAPARQDSVTHNRTVAAFHGALAVRNLFPGTVTPDPERDHYQRGQH